MLCLGDISQKGIQFWYEDINRRIHCLYWQFVPLKICKLFLLWIYLPSAFSYWLLFCNFFSIQLWIYYNAFCLSGSKFPKCSWALCVTITSSAFFTSLLIFVACRFYQHCATEEYVMIYIHKRQWSFLQLSIIQVFPDFWVFAYCQSNKKW